MKFIRTILVACAAFIVTVGVAFAVYPASFTSWTVGDKITSSWLNTIEQMIGTGSTSTSLTTQLASGTVHSINNLSTSSVFLVATGTGFSNASSGNTVTFTLSSSSYLQPGNNLSEVSNSSTATTNIGALRASNDLSDVQSSSTARVNLLSTGAGLNQSATGTVSLAAPVSQANGGTGTSTVPADGQFLSSNQSTATWKSFVAGANITIATTTTSTIITSTAGAVGPMTRLGRTISTEATTTVKLQSLGAKEFLQGYIHVPISVGGGFTPGIRFNNDSAVNYNGVQFVYIGNTGSFIGASSSVYVPSFPATNTSTVDIVFNIVNEASSTKSIFGQVLKTGTTAAAQNQEAFQFSAVWVSTSSITEVDVVNANGGLVPTSTIIGVYGSAD